MNVKRLVRVVLAIVMAQMLSGCMTYCVILGLGWDAPTKTYSVEASRIEVPSPGPDGVSQPVRVPYWDGRSNPSVDSYLLAANRLDWGLADQQFNTPDVHSLRVNDYALEDRVQCPQRFAAVQRVKELPPLALVQYGDLVELIKPCDSGYVAYVAENQSAGRPLRLAVFRIAEGRIASRTYVTLPAKHVESHYENIPAYVGWWLLLPVAVIGDIVFMPVEAFM